MYVCGIKDSRYTVTSRSFYRRHNWNTILVKLFLFQCSSFYLSFRKTVRKLFDIYFDALQFYFEIKKEIVFSLDTMRIFNQQQIYIVINHYEIFNKHNDKNLHIH
jgi:hypothetical protein